MELQSWINASIFVSSVPRQLTTPLNLHTSKLAKWLDEKIKPLTANKYTITDALCFAEEIRKVHVDKDHIFVSYDVTALFTAVPFKDTTEILFN